MCQNRQNAGQKPDNIPTVLIHGDCLCPEEEKIIQLCCTRTPAGQTVTTESRSSDLFLIAAAFPPFQAVAKKMTA